jgi:hypothetical protein
MIVSHQQVNLHERSSEVINEPAAGGANLLQKRQVNGIEKRITRNGTG